MKSDMMKLSENMKIGLGSLAGIAVGVMVGNKGMNFLGEKHIYIENNTEDDEYYISDETLKKRHKDEQRRFSGFVKELEKLSEKYNILITSTGGVRFPSLGEKVKRVKYDDDASSHDLNIDDVEWL